MHSSPDLTAVISAVAAVAAAWFAFVSAQAAKRANDFAKRDAERREKGLAIYIVDAQMYRVRTDDVRLHDFSVRITNMADAPNSIAELSLEIEYRRRDSGWIPRLQIPADSRGTGRVEVAQPVLRTPLVPQPLEVAAGHLFFPVA